MRWLALIVCVVTGCKPKEPPKQHDAQIIHIVTDDESPFDAAVEPVVETKPVTIELPVTDRRPERGEALVVAVVPGGLRLVDASKIVVDRTKVTIPEGETVTPQQVASRVGAAGVLVVADAKATMGDVSGVAFALHAECWAFAAVNQNALVGIWPKPCPVPPVEAKAKQLAVALEVDRTTIGIRGALDANNALAEPPQFLDGGMKLAAAREGFSSLTFAVAEDMPIGTLVPLIVLMQKDVPATLWVPEEWLPTRFPNGFGNDAIPIPPPAPTSSLPIRGGPLTVTATLGKLVIAKNAAYTEDEVSRVVRARQGIWRACYQKELNRTPTLKGTLNVSFEIGADGAVTSATGAGVSDAVRTCVSANFMRLEFPPKGAKTKVRVPITYTSQ